MFPLEQELHLRTRLSHSYEVASTASLLFSEIMAKQYDGKSVSEIVGDADKVEALRNSLMAACLLHDVGNPPFGYAGEGIIRRWFERNQKSFSEKLAPRMIRTALSE